MTNLRLNKLAYFAQAYNLGLYNDVLFKEDIEAWKFGPVVRDIYDEYKIYGEKNLPAPENNLKLSKQDFRLLSAVLFKYGNYSSSDLIKLTHKKGSPWDTVYHSEENIIPPSLIASYYKKENLFVYPEDKIIRKRDKDGYILLPEDFND